MIQGAAVQVLGQPTGIIGAMSEMKSKAERAYDVLCDPRFYEAGWSHFGHDGACPAALDWGPCRQYRVGLKLGLRHGVSWVRGATPTEALERAALVLFDGVPIEQIPGSDP